jgi:hypothetical protein
MDPDLKKQIIINLKKYYPISIPFNNIKNLSHFNLQNIHNFHKFLPFHMNINGLILDGEYKDYKIIKVITSINKVLNWDKYILLNIFLLDNDSHPQIDKNKFMNLLHTYNKILIIKKK